VAINLGQFRETGKIQDEDKQIKNKTQYVMDITMRNQPQT
jgi:hypothetical protein